MTDRAWTPSRRSQTDPSRSGGFPRARSRGLLVEELDEETLVYDLSTHEAHCLNKAAAVVWSGSDGKTSVEALAKLLPKAGLPRNEDLVWLTLDRLDRAGLLSRSEPPAPTKAVSRREVLRALGATAGLTFLLPAVNSVTAPLAAQAASCLTRAQCRSLRPPNCTGLPICNRRNVCCTEVTTRRGRRRCRPRRC